MSLRKILLSTLVITSFAQDNMLSISSGLETHHVSIGVDPVNYSIGFPSFAASLGLSLEKFVSNNVSYTLNANTHLLQDHISDNYGTPAFSSTFLTSYYVSPQYSVGAGLTITHHADLKFLHSVCYTLQMKSWVTESLYAAFELNNDSNATNTAIKYVTDPRDLAQGGEEAAYLASKLLNLYHNSVRLSVGYRFLKNFSLEDSANDESDLFENDTLESDLFDF